MGFQPARHVETVGEIKPDQKITLVTGAAGGLGQAIGERLHEAGHAIILVDLNGERAAEVARDRGWSAVAIEADLSRAEAPAEIMEIVAKQPGHLDNLVNNAGIQPPLTLATIELADWELVMSVNLRAPMLLAKHALRFWKARGGGAIVSIGSRTWASGSDPVYTASKAGVVGLTRSFTVELGALNVRANVVAPGYVDTPLTRAGKTDEDVFSMQQRVLSITPLPRLGTPQDVAGAVAFLVSDDASFITGEVLHVAGGSQLANRPPRYRKA